MSEATITSNGGKRAGAGRKKASHTIETEAAKKKIVEMVNENIESITLPQIKKAQKGDTRAYEALMDRAHGRPAQTIEHSGDVKLLVDF